MNKAFVIFLILAFGLDLQLKAQIDSTIQGDLSDLIIEQNSDFFIQYSDSEELESGLMAHFFLYKIRDDRWPYGSGFEITHPRRETPLWVFKKNGDQGLHSLKQIDINEDGNMDLFFYAGSEDVFSTYIYTANYSDGLNTDYTQDNFLRSYSSENDYSVLIRLNGETQPLILDSGYEGNEKRSGRSCFEDQSKLAVMPQNSLTITDPVREEIVQKYKEITGELDRFNFDYNMPDSYPLFNTFILDPVRLLRIEGHELKDVTSQYPDYLKWRIRILKMIREESSENCTPNIDRTIRHLESYL